MNSSKYVHMSNADLTKEIERMTNKLDEIRNDIAVLESLKLANEIREKKKQGNPQNPNHKNHSNG